MQSKLNGSDGSSRVNNSAIDSRNVPLKLITIFISLSVTILIKHVLSH